MRIHALAFANGHEYLGSRTRTRYSNEIIVAQPYPLTNNVAITSSIPNPSARPYPSQYVSPWTAKDGTEVVIRPIRPDDEPALATFHGTLSDRTVYFRYFCSLDLANRTAHERLAHICACDFVSELVLVVERKDPNTAKPSILAVGRLNKLKNDHAAEVALLVADPYQRLGLGTELLRRLVEVARAEGIHRIVAEILRDNIAVQAVFKKCDFRLSSVEGDFTEVQAVLEL